MMNVHAQQIASVLRRALQMRLTRGLHDPRVRGMISVTEVQLTDDLSEARVKVSILPEEHAELTMKGLYSATGHLRREIAQEISLRRMPRLIFKYDTSLKKQADVHAAIHRAVGEPVESDDDSEASGATPAAEDRPTDGS